MSEKKTSNKKSTKKLEEVESVKIKKTKSKIETKHDFVEARVEKRVSSRKSIGEEKLEDDSHKRDIEVELVKLDSKERYQPAFFFPRALAYIIDFVIVTILSMGVLMVVPVNENHEKYMKEYQKVQTDYIEKKIDTLEYTNKLKPLIYDLDYSNVPTMIIQIVILILYYIVFQFYNKGQTLGKKLMKIRVISLDDEDVSMNQLIIRSLINQAILSNILIVGFVLFIGRNLYYYSSFGIQGIQVLITIISIFMIMYSKKNRGLHDYLAKTKVIMTD